MKKRLNKALAALLALVMVVALVPTVALADALSEATITNISVTAAGKVTVSGYEKKGTLKYAIVDEDKSATCQSWDSTSTEPESVKESVGVSTWENFDDTEGITVKYADAKDGKYILIIDDQESKVVGWGTKKLEEIKNDSAALTKVEVSDPKGENSTPGDAGTEANSPKEVTVNVAFVADKTGKTVTLTTNAASAVKYIEKENDTEKPQDNEYDSASDGSTTMTVDLSKVYFVRVTAENGETKGYYCIKFTVAAGDNNASLTQVTVDSATVSIDALQNNQTAVTSAEELTHSIGYSSAPQSPKVKLEFSSLATAKYVVKGSGESVSEANEINQDYSSVQGEGISVDGITSDTSKVVYIELTAQDTTTKHYYKLTINMAEQAQTVAPTINTSTVTAETETTAKFTVDNPSYTGTPSVKVYDSNGDDNLDGAVTGVYNAGTITLTKASKFTDDSVSYQITLTEDNKKESTKVTVTVKAYVAPVVEDPKITNVQETPLTVGTDVSTLTVTTDKNFKSGLSESDVGKFTFSDSGLTVTNVSGGSTTATLTMSGAPTKNGTVTLTVAKDAFEPAAKNDVTYSITVEQGKVTAANLKSPESGTITVAEDEHLFTADDVISKKLNSLEIELTCGEKKVTPASVSWQCKDTYDPAKTSTEQTFTGTPTPPAEYKWDSVAQTVEVKVTLSVEQTQEVTPAPSTPTTPSTTVDQPATDADSGTTTVDVNTNSTTSGTTANATVPSSSMNSAVNSAVSAAESAGTTPVVEVEVKTSSRADGIKVTLPTGALDKLAAVEDAELIITSDVAEVALDSTAIGAVAEQAGANAVLTVTPSKTLNAAQTEAADGAPVYDLTLTSNGKEITEFDGGVLTITVPYALPEGNDASTVRVSYLDDEGKLTPCATVYDAAAGKVVFETTHLSKYVITSEAVHVCPADKFSDVDQTAWYHEAVDFVVEKGIMIGVSGDKFDPMGVTTRGTIMTILARMKGVDTADSEPWYQAGVDWAVENGVSDGTAQEREITRVELVTMLYRYLDEPAADVAVLDDFEDGDAVPEWGAEAMAWAVANDLVKGRAADGEVTLSPLGTATRVEVAEIVMTFSGLTGN